MGTHAKEDATIFQLRLKEEKKEEGKKNVWFSVSCGHSDRARACWRLRLTTSKRWVRLLDWGYCRPLTAATTFFPASHCSPFKFQPQLKSELSQALKQIKRNLNKSWKSRQVVLCHLSMEWAAASPLLTYKKEKVEQKEWTEPSPVPTRRRASREMSNFPKLSPALSQKNKNGFAGFSSLSVAPSDSALSESSIKGRCCRTSTASRPWLESCPERAQQPAPTALRVGETKLTVHNSPSLNLCNKVSL